MSVQNRASQHNFSRIPSATIPRSVFDRSFGRKQTFNADYLVPIFVDEVLPGDTFNMRMSTFARLATPIVPVMDNLKLDFFFFFVPNRLVWNNWQRMNGEQDNPNDSTDYLVPQATANNEPLVVGENTLQNYMGLPKGTIDVRYCPISALPTRCYNLIWNEWFRDQNLQQSVKVDKDDGPDNPADYVLLKRGKRHDYFTSALPWPQKGPAVELPLGLSAPISLADGTDTLYRRYDTDAIASGSIQLIDGVMNIPADTNVYIDLNGSHVADLSEATAATINQLREAFQIQKLYERDARGGTRYTEILRSHFGVISPDARLQRPEYLGGGSTNISFHPVAQTSETADSPQGNLAAFGTHASNHIGFSKSFVEHGTIIGLAAMRADLSYQQGVNKMWNRRTRFDFYWPALSHLGEQAILNSEIYTQGTTADQGVFGYQERWAEYRYKPSEILGTFMSTVTAPLDQWHLAQEFTTLPGLNASFIESDTPIDRVIAVNTEPHLLFDAYFHLRCARPMPTYSVPGLIDHF